MRRYQSLLLLALLVVFWFAPLGVRDLMRPDEGRYAEIAREMLVSGDWVTPRQTGLKYFEKPPLQYWATAAAFAVFGENAWSARLWTALCGLLLSLGVGFTAWRIYQSQAIAWLAGLIYASTAMGYLVSHFNTLDSGFAAWLGIAVLLFALLLDEQAIKPRERPYLQGLAWFALALAFLSKGLAAPVLAGACVVLFCGWQRSFKPLAQLATLRGIGLFLLVTLPWVVLVSWRNAEFFQFFFIHEHFQRFLTKVHDRYEPWYFFVVVFVPLALPWTSVMLQGLWRTARNSEKFLGLWVVLVMLFFSASDSKLVSYILPIMPALAVLAAASWMQSSARVRGWHSLLTLLLTLAMVAVTLYLAAAEFIEPKYFFYRRIIWLALALLVLAALFAWWQRRQALRAGVVLALAGMMTWCLILLGHQSLSEEVSAHGMVQRLGAVDATVPFFSVRSYDETLPFYLQRTLTLVQHQGELVMGQQSEPHLAYSSVEQWLPVWHSLPKAYASMNHSTLQELRANGLGDGQSFSIAASNPSFVIIQKP